MIAYSVTQRTKDQGSGAAPRGGIDQRIEFEAECSTAERKGFDQQRVRLFLAVPAFFVSGALSGALF